jgi:nitrate reductase cytochrome c-type subunit
MDPRPSGFRESTEEDQENLAEWLTAEGHRRERNWAVSPPVFPPAVASPA